MDYMLIATANSLCQLLTHQQKLSAILSPCAHLSFLICVLFFFFSHHLVACSFFNHFTLASLTNLTLFFFFFVSHIQAVHSTHFKILLFLPVPVLKSCHFLSGPKAKKPHPNIYIHSNMFSSSTQNLFCGYTT